MNNLYESFGSVAYGNMIHKKGLTANHYSFWHPQGESSNIPYEELNNAYPYIYTNEAIRRYQLSKIKNFSQAVLAKTNYEEVSQFLLNDTTSSSQYASQENIEIQKAIQNIYNTFTELQSYRTGATSKENWSKENRYNIWLKTQSVLLELETKIKELENKISSSGGVNAEVLERIDFYLKYLPKVSSITTKVGDRDFWYHLNLLKGTLLEELGVDWYNSVIPEDMNVKAYRTGNIQHNKQNIKMDILTFSTNDPELDKIEITYTLGKSKRIYTKTLKDFLNDLDKGSYSETIDLTDASYEILSEKNKLAIQAKSGAKQLPWNPGANYTNVAIEELTSSEGGYLSAARTIELLDSLNHEIIWDSYNMESNSWFKNETWLGKYTQALANYALANKLNRVLSISKSSNQYLLTAKGFKSYPEYIEYLFELFPNRTIYMAGLESPIPNIKKMRSINFNSK